VKLVARGIYISAKPPTGVQLAAISSVPGRVQRHARLCAIQWLPDTKDCSTEQERGCDHACARLSEIQGLAH
jgi:hypothetical protein